MPGNKIGGKKAAKKNIELYGKNFYATIGSIGGHNGKGPNYTGGFASKKVGPDGMTGSQRAKIAGAKGGKTSTRAGVKNGAGKTSNKDIEELEEILEEEDGRDTSFAQY